MERYYRFRTISSIIAIIIILFVAYPLQMTLATIFCLAVYFLCRRLGERTVIDKGIELRRREALRIAKIYLAPYKSIWANLKLTNKHCSLKLANQNTIYGVELHKPFRQFKIIATNTHDWTDLWDMFCKSFNHNTTYEGLVKLCRLYDTTIMESSPTPVVVEKKAPATAKKVDVNNASEVELTALPGVSIVMAKKLIKKREEIGGFKNIEDVFLFLRLKTHMQEQLKNLICVNKMQGYTKIERSTERKLDL